MGWCRPNCSPAGCGADDVRVKAALVALVILLAAPFLAGCSERETPSAGPSSQPSIAPTSWLGMEPGDARAFDGPGGELVLIFVDETYDFTRVAGEYASAITWQHGDRYTTDYWVHDDDGTLWWLGRKGSWRAGRDGAQPRELSLSGNRVRFGDRVITLSADGPTGVETPDGSYAAIG